MTQQKVALITGANKGIGFQIAVELSDLGFHVIITARDEARGAKALEKLKTDHKELVVMDVSDPASIAKAFSEVQAKHEKLDVLINNAGILKDEGYTILDTPVDVSLQTLQTNALGPLWVTQYFLPLLAEGSRVVMMSSGAGTFCDGIGTWAPIYSISKTTLNAITRQLNEVMSSKGIVIYAMCPGWVRTDMGGMAASRSVEKGAETAVWLATDAPETITGEFFRDKKEISW